MPSDLNLSTVELTSTLITAPLNGAPSSADYNSCQRANLIDLSTLVSFINNQILPLVNALSADALQPTNTPVGIQGNTIWANTADQSALFFDSLSATPLTIYDSFLLLNGIITTNSQQLIDLGIEVASLQSILASTNQNDVSLALQNITSSLNQTIIIQNNQGIELASLLQLLNNEIAIATTHLTTPMVQNAVVIGNGGGDLTVLGSLGTTTTVLHGNAFGPPSFSAVVEVDLNLSNNTTNNVSTSHHGFVPILPGDPTVFLNGTGGFTTPPGSGGSGGGFRGSFAQTLGDGSSLSFMVDHNLNTTDLVVNVYNLSTGEIEIVDSAIIDANRLSVTFSVAPGLNEERAVIFSSGGNIGAGSGGAFSTTIGNGSSTIYSITHNLTTTDVIVGVHNLSTGELEIVDVDIIDSNNVSITFGAPPSLNSERVIILSVGASGGGGGGGASNYPPVTHQFLNSYDSTSGLFTSAQPSISDLSTATAPTTIPMAGNTLVFNWNTALSYNIQLGTTTAATNLANQDSASLGIFGHYWSGIISLIDEWKLQGVLGTGSNPNSTLSITQSGSSGVAIVQVPGLDSINGFKYNSTAPAGTALISNGAYFVAGNLESIQSISANATIGFSQAPNTLIRATAGSGITLTLPTAIGKGGQIIRIVQVDTGSGGVAVITTGGQTINGLSTYVLTNQWQTISMESDNANWIIISSAN